MASGAPDNDDMNSSNMAPSFGTGQGQPPRLKQGLALSDLLAGGSTFEIETGNGAGMTLEAEFGEDMLESELIDKNYLSDPKSQESELLQSISMDEVQGFFDDVVAEMEDLTPDGKIKKKIVREGQGEIVSYEGKVFYNYEIFAEGEDGPFDSSLQRGVVESLTFTDADCIEGLSIALQSMKVKEISKFWIHHEYAYGRMGAPPRIPPAAALMCTVELLDTISGEKLKGIHFMSPEQRHFLPFGDIMKAAQDLRSKGNSQFAEMDYMDSTASYKRAIDYLDTYTTVKPEEEKERTDLLFTLYCNIAQSFLRWDKPAKACGACSRGLKLPVNPMKHKILYRFAQAKFALKHFEDAFKLCQQSLNCAPTKYHREIRNFLKQCETSQKEVENDQGLAEMYKKMLVSDSSNAGAAGPSPKP